jgi:REP element-mobilizing transposase RayT
MTQPHREFNNDRIPLAYLITFRAFGTWLHGDSRGSVDRFHNRYGSPPISPNRRWRQYNEHALKRPPVRLTAKRRAAIEAAIRETCKIRQWKLWAMNVRTNHVHSVVTGNCGPEIVLNSLKANATRQMKESGCWQTGKTPWVKNGSKRCLWNEQDLFDAIAYVEYEQGRPLS